MKLFGAPWIVALFITQTQLCYTADIYESRVTGSGVKYEELISPKIQPEGDTRKFTGLKLNNRMEAILVSDSSADKSIVSVTLKAGFKTDPKKVPGMAHFIEHLLYLGSVSYPDENGFREFISKNSGFTNAQTTNDHTRYYFSISNEALVEGVDRLSELLISPLIKQELIDTEAMALDAEFKMKHLDDHGRAEEIKRLFSNPEHSYSKFTHGSYKSLITVPRSQGIDTRKEVLEFFETYYSANIMKLSVVSSLPIEDIKELVIPKFSQIKDRNIPTPAFPGSIFREEDKAILIKTVPFTEYKAINLQFEVPSILKHKKERPDKVIASFFHAEGPGSISSLLKSKGWANGINIGVYDNFDDYSILNINITPTQVGLGI